MSQTCNWKCNVMLIDVCSVNTHNFIHRMIQMVENSKTKYNNSVLSDQWKRTEIRSYHSLFFG